MIGTLAVDGWTVTFGTVKNGLGWAMYQLYIIRRWTIIAFAL